MLPSLVIAGPDAAPVEPIGQPWSVRPSFPMVVNRVRRACSVSSPEAR